MWTFQYRVITRILEVQSMPVTSHDLASRPGQLRQQVREYGVVAATFHGKPWAYMVSPSLWAEAEAALQRERAREQQQEGVMT
jgi:hypothetical protein